MLQVRNGIFETNSSSVHSLTFHGDEEFTAFLCGERFYDIWYDKLITRNELVGHMYDDGYHCIEDYMEHTHRFWSFDSLCKLGYHYGGSAYARTEDLPDGGHVNYICYYGHD